ncbi:hypothetical protein C8Q74DRAFT_1207392, partial [Fomes fomentarius]
LTAGVYCACIPQCLIILRRKVREGLPIWLPIAMFSHVAIDDIVRAYHAYGTGENPNIHPDPGVVFAPSAPSEMVKTSLLVVLALISDGIIVYRTFVVWNFNKLVIALPIGLWLTGIAFGIWTAWTLGQTRTGDNIMAAAAATRVRYLFVITFCLNMLCASLICWKIWRVSSPIAEPSSSDRITNRVFRVVIETAGMYCAFLFALIVSDRAGSNVFFVFLEPLPPVTALVFTMLIVRTQPRARDHSSTGTLPTLRFWTSPRSLEHPSQSGTGVQIDLERVVHMDSRSESFGPRPDARGSDKGAELDSVPSL